jgi:hypothetical protein
VSEVEDRICKNCEAWEDMELRAKLNTISATLACLLDHYLGCYGGHFDALAAEAARLVPDWEEKAGKWTPAKGQPNE